MPPEGDGRGEGWQSCFSSGGCDPNGLCLEPDGGPS